MSNRRRIKKPKQNPVNAQITALDGAEIPGGCTHCNAVQIVRANADGPGLHKMTVHHDDWCPWWTAARTR